MRTHEQDVNVYIGDGLHLLHMLRLPARVSISTEHCQISHHPRPLHASAIAAFRGSVAILAERTSSRDARAGWIWDDALLTVQSNIGTSFVR